MVDSEQQPHAKRRKLDQAARILRRPFTSPLSSFAKADASKVVDRGGRIVKQPACTHQVSTDGSKHTNRDTSQLDAAVPLSYSQSTHTAASAHEHLHDLNASSLSTVDRDKQADLTRRQLRLLEIETRAIRGEIDKLERAIDIQRSHNDSHLECLINKWRKAAQMAADELLPHVRERKANMTHTSSSQADVLSAHHDIDAEDTCAQHVMDCDISKAQPETGYCLDAVSKTVAAALNDDDHSFTMRTMLQYLNIDTDLIGYDIKKEEWL